MARTRLTLPCWTWMTPMAANSRRASRAIGLDMPKAGGDLTFGRKRIARLEPPIDDRLAQPLDDRIAEPARGKMPDAPNMAVHCRWLGALRRYVCIHHDADDTLPRRVAT